MTELRSWLVLALVIEQPSYGYELGQRDESRFGRLLPLTLPRVYQVLDDLHDRSLIEPTELDTATRRTALRHGFRATSSGMRAYRSWLSSSLASRVALWEL